MTEIENLARLREMAAENRERAEALDQDSESGAEQVAALRFLSGLAELGPKRSQIEATAAELEEASGADPAKAATLRSVADLFESIVEDVEQQAPSS